MKFTEAYRSLGYEVEVPRQDWSADSPAGVCISIWKKEMRMRDGLLWIDTREHCDPLDTWKDKPGNTKRIKHLSLAAEKHGGALDVVILDGTPGIGFGDAHPWDSVKRGAFWHLVDFDPETNHYSAEVRRSNTSS